jgi:hypothetical protein
MHADEQKFVVQLVALAAHTTQGTFARWAVLHSDTAHWYLQQVASDRLMERPILDMLTFEEFERF